AWTAPFLVRSLRSWLSAGIITGCLCWPSVLSMNSGKQKILCATGGPFRSTEPAASDVLKCFRSWSYVFRAQVFLENRDEVITVVSAQVCGLLMGESTDSISWRERTR